MNCPTDLLYAASHEWVRLEESQATVGITEHAQRELTDIVYVEFPKIGKHYSAGKPLCVVESVKAASDIYAPLSGTIEAINPELSANPSLLNSDPYGAGWIFKIRPDPDPDLSSLKSAAEYSELLPNPGSP
jgi:glycine cleavage system H protein